MFRLQRLEITGFKSFADHTEIVFTGDGITAVVGPNGCGKSNVADAISWVLGEQRAKQLRGGEMKDVIFQGARNRPPGGMAEVVLHMVRVEADEAETDIDDIDSALEEIDEQSAQLAPTESAPESSATQIENAAANNNVQSSAAKENGAAMIEAANTLEENAVATDSATASLTSVGDSAKSVSDAANPVETAAKKAAGKRHWRRPRLALEFAPGEAVSVTRRLYRSGESEYLLNGRACRLRDIQDLFSGTGLAGAHYAIIEQGRIGQILSAKPMDRRTLIEEAAGITKFRVRQRAAEARLEAARTNLSRVNDIISEIERQTTSLRRQAAKARRYRELREELRELLRRVYVAEEQALVVLLDETRRELDQTADEERRLSEDLAAREEAARGATQQARALEEELTAQRAAQHEAALQRDRRQREYAYQQEQASALETRRSATYLEIETVRARLSDVEAEIERLRANEVEQREASESSAHALQAAESAYNARLEAVAQAETQIEATRSELLTHTAMTERLMEIGRQLEATLERLQQQADALAREGERAGAVHAARTTEAESLQADIEAARARLDLMRAERDELTRTLTEAREFSRARDAEHTRVRDELARISHRLDSLLELDAQRAHYSPAVQRLFTTDKSANSSHNGNGAHYEYGNNGAHDSNGAAINSDAPGANGAPEDFHFVATLADVLRVEPQWERAVEGIFGEQLQTIIVPTPDDALRAAAWLRAANAGRAGFLVAGLHGASDEANSATATTTLAFADEHEANDIADNSDEVRVGDLLNAPRELRRVLQRALPEKMNARVISNLDDAMAQSLATNETYVTVEGDCVMGGSLVNAGLARSLEEGAGLLAFKRELRELETRAAELQQELARAEAAATQARTRTGELEDAVVLLNDGIGREEREFFTREVNAAGLAQEIERAARHMRVVREDADRLAIERAEVEARRDKAFNDAQTADALRREAADTVTAATTELLHRRREAEAENENLGALRAAAAAAAERRRATSAERRRIEAEHAELTARLERHTREINEADARLEELRAALIEMEQRAESVEAMQRAESDVAALAVQLAAARDASDALAVQLAELNRRAAMMRDSRAGLEIQRAESAARLAYVREACAAELNQSLEELARSAAAPQEDEPAFDLEAARARVEELRAKVEGFGAVNMMALEELAEAEERFKFLTSQRQDITEAVASTNEALREIKRRSRERFRHAFEHINRNFTELFQELFGGGRGEMNLIDAEDVLESGIDIVAQPPGKRLQSVLLLSGGEKAMAALALVLAIFRYRPSPFCLLDEVDAPLDEANVGRFTNKISEMSARTQFIVITHNKRTMEMARALYGVTMQEAGVSKLVSVKFE